MLGLNQRLPPCEDNGRASGSQKLPIFYEPVTLVTLENLPDSPIEPYPDRTQNECVRPDASSTADEFRWRAASRSRRRASGFAAVVQLALRQLEQIARHLRKRFGVCLVETYRVGRQLLEDQERDAPVAAIGEDDGDGLPVPTDDDADDLVPARLRSTMPHIANVFAARAFDATDRATLAPGREDDRRRGSRHA